MACIIFENYLLGRKRAIWLSVSSDLKFDSERDLRDIGAGNIKVDMFTVVSLSVFSSKLVHSCSQMQTMLMCSISLTDGFRDVSGMS